MSATPPSTTPTYVELDRDNKRLLMRWSDEHESSFDWEHLRWRCPCAECSGEGGTPGALQSLPMFRPGQTIMNDVNLTGRYGLTLAQRRPQPRNLHVPGMLRAICPCEACVAARGGEAPRGRNRGDR